MVGNRVAVHVIREPLGGPRISVVRDKHGSVFAVIDPARWSEADDIRAALEMALNGSDSPPS